jgi:hypothetical protein
MCPIGNELRDPYPRCRSMCAPRNSWEIAKFNDPPDYRLTKGADPSSAHLSSTIGDISG